MEDPDPIAPNWLQSANMRVNLSKSPLGVAP